MKTAELVVLEIMENHDFQLCQDAVRQYANAVASAALAKACEGLHTIYQTKIMNVKIETP